MYQAIVITDNLIPEIKLFPEHPRSFNKTYITPNVYTTDWFTIDHYGYRMITITFYPHKVVKEVISDPFSFNDNTYVNVITQGCEFYFPEINGSKIQNEVFNLAFDYAKENKLLTVISEKTVLRQVFDKQNRGNDESSISI